MSMSRAAVFRGSSQPITLQDIPLPTPGDGELLVRILGCTLCGSDLHTATGRRSTPLPTILGHEILGEIVALGPNAPTQDFGGTDLQKGDRITWSIAASCGECFYCTRDLPQKCVALRKYGHEAMTPGYELLGGLAEHALLLKGTALVKVPDELPLAVACPANCATATIAGALRAAGNVTGATVCVFGMGMLGLTAAAMADATGAETVVAIDVDATRLGRAHAFGAAHAVQPRQLDALTKDLTDGHGFDVVLEISGHEQAFRQGWDALRIGGTMVLVGSVFPAPPVGIELEQIVRRNVTLRGVHNYAPRDLATAVAFLTEHHGRYPFADLVGPWYPLEQTAEALEAGLDPRYIRVGVGG